MRFGPVPAAEAEGAVLAHSLALPGGRLRKGRVLTGEDAARIAAAGLEEVTVARLEPGDVDENAAAERIASALAPDPAALGLRRTGAGTGRVNLYALGPGVLEVDAGRVAALNRIDPMITLATLAPHARVREGAMAATIKIIAYAVPEASVAAAERAAAGAVLRLAPVARRSAALIQTDIGEGAGPGEEAIRARLDALGIALVHVESVAHRTAPLARAVEAAPGEMVLILTASATSDPADVGPEAVRAAGGRVERFGMPVDPGNLLFLGEQGGRPVIGLPGCARSPALNGADWVLERVACGVAVGADDIAAMGVGGLLKESPARPHPRERR